MKETYGSTMIQALKTVLPIQKRSKPSAKKGWIALLIYRGRWGRALLAELEGMTSFKARERFLLEALLQDETGKIDTAMRSKELGTTAFPF
ncbi:MAG: hypothetical protein ACLUVM_08640 [Blautia faecis]